MSDTWIHRLFVVIALSVLQSVFVMAGGGINDEINRQLQILKENPEDKDALRKVCFLYLNKADYDNAIYYGEKLFDIGYSERDYNGSVIYSHICLGQAYMMKGDVGLAYDNLGQAERIGIENKNDSALCSVYNGLGLYESNVRKDYYRALSYFFKGVDAARRSRFKRMYSILMTNIAGIYYLKNDTTGLKYALECYELGHDNNDPYLIYSGSTNVAYMYYLKGDFANAHRYIQESEFTMLKNDFYDQTNVYNLYGLILYAQKDYDGAMKYFRKAMDYGDYGNTSSLVNTHLSYARVLMVKGRYEEAIDILKKGIEISYKYACTIFRSDMLYELSVCYEALGRYDKALMCYKKYKTEDDSLYNAEKERTVGEIRAKYDLERQENEIKQNRLEILEKENRLNLLAAGLVCIIVALSLLYYLYRRKNRLYVAIVRQNQESIRREKQLHERIAELSQMKSASQDTVPAEKYAASSLTEEKKLELFRRLERLLENDKIYRDNLLNKTKVADMLGTNRTYLSQIINEQTGQTFTQFVNGFRIQEAVRILSDPNNDTPLKAVSAELGFNSMTTFYSQFQTATGMAPAQYRNKVQELHNNG